MLSTDGCGISFIPQNTLTHDVLCTRSRFQPAPVFYFSSSTGSQFSSNSSRALSVGSQETDSDANTPAETDVAVA